MVTNNYEESMQKTVLAIGIFYVFKTIFLLHL